MPEPWAAQTVVTPDIAAAAIAQQFPQLSGRAIEPLGEGWDNAAFLVGGNIVFRFPRREIAVPLLETEMSVLPVIAPVLPLAIPIPRYAGVPSKSFRWPFAGYALLPGAPLSTVQLDGAAYDRLAGSLGRFLSGLHGIKPETLPHQALQPDAIGRLHHPTRMPLVRSRLVELQAAGLIGDAHSSIAFLDAVAPNGPRKPLAVVHGDLYARHVMVDAERNACAIIDWGDLHLGDPAVDLSVAYEVLPPHARRVFAAAYGPIDEETRRYARYRATYHAALVAHYGFRIDAPDLLNAGLPGLRFANAPDE
jgi:aminoglycoside phosphotransferase (APT) family kinase protein